MSEDKKIPDHEFEYDEDGKLVKARLSREKLFRDKWDRTIDIRFYSKQHVQRLSIACKRFLGVQGKDWDNHVNGFSRVSDLIKHNLESEEEMKDQVFILGLKDNGNNDIEGFEDKLKRLKLKYLFSGALKG
jgi:hypothetical protein